MAEKQNKPVSSLTKFTKVRKHLSFAELRRNKRNKTRRLRRKRSNLRFQEELRISRITKCLQRSVHVYDMTTESGNFEPSLTDVAQWQNQHQIAYWKSRAISLEYENQMLHQHIRKMYTKQINEYVQDAHEIESGCSENKPARKQLEEKKIDKFSLPPEEPVGKAKRDEMKKLYGSTAPKITGMETAVQLNYNFQVDKFNPPMWPNLPFNA